MLRRLLDSPWFYFGLAALLLVVGVASQFELTVPGRPWGGLEEVRELEERDDVNVVFVLVDTLRADHLSAYGYERETSPFLEDMAQVGVRFERVRAQSTWTKTSMASLWTGTYPVGNGVLRFDHAVSEDVTMPAEVFRDAGFRTAGVYRNGWVDPNFGFAQGFDVYLKPTASRTPERFQRRNPSAHPLLGTDLDVTTAAIEFIRSNKSRRFFLYVHYMDVHQYLYDEGSALFGTDYEGAYDNAIRWTDKNIAALVSALEETGIHDRTLVVLASDHGEAFYEHGTEGHAKNLYSETTDTPLLISFPFRLREPLVIGPRVRNIDIWPTVLDLVGLPELPEAEGVSLVPLIEAGLRKEPVDGAAPETSFAHLDRRWGHVETEPVPVVSVTESQDRLIVWPHDPDAIELFDLEADPLEQENRAEGDPERVAQLRQLLDAYLEGRPAEGRVEQVEVDAMKLEQLRALGYVVQKERIDRQRAAEERRGEAEAADPAETAPE